MDFEDITFIQDDLEAFFEKMDEDLDFAFALSLQDEFNETDSKKKNDGKNSPYKKVSSAKVDSKLGIVDPQWELIDPNPDIHGLFIEFNAQFFYGKLEGVEVKWSPKMTLCAGVCCYEGRGGLCSVRLSLPLLKLRPRRDLVETLLHEMIHAYLFVTANNKDHDAHGPEFCSHMYRINKETGTKISIYHSFHDEVDLYRKHWWKCNGPCQQRKPYFGLVKRAMNRAPGPKDNWFSQHQATCGGTFVKIKEPEEYKAKNLKRKIPEKKECKSANIKSFFQDSPKIAGVHNSTTTVKKSKSVDTNAAKTVLGQENTIVSVFSQEPLASSAVKERTTQPFTGNGFKLGFSSSKMPTSFLSDLQRELSTLKSMHNSNLQSLKNSQIKSVASKKPSSSDAENVKGSSSGSTKYISEKAENSKLHQSSIDCFVNSPLKYVENGKDCTIGSLKTDSTSKIKSVMCPVCYSLQLEDQINTHLDQCLSKNG